MRVSFDGMTLRIDGLTPEEEQVLKEYTVALNAEHEMVRSRMVKAEAALREIAETDVREVRTCIKSDPAGNKHRLGKVPGQFAKIALEVLKEAEISEEILTTPPDVATMN